MRKTRTKAPWALIVLLLPIGAASAVLALWLNDHRLVIPKAGTIIALLMGMFFVCVTWALMRFLHWRGLSQGPSMVGSLRPEELDGTVYGLVSGAEYQVVQSFTDYYSNHFQRGELLRYKERHFLPYEGGHTLIFDERSLYLHEYQNSAILGSFSEYIAQIER
jgi:hypothetical protein